MKAPATKPDDFSGARTQFMV